MSNLITDYQKKSMDEKYSVSDLLRHALIIASKLKLENIKSWINFELYGYEGEKKVPKYRKISVEVKFLNSIYGWCPIVITDNEILKQLSSIPIPSSVSELESLINNKKNEIIRFSPPGIIKEHYSNQVPFDTDICYESNISSVVGILDKIKTKLLEWILELEENEIIDKDMLFTEEQQVKAKAVSYNVINNFYGDKGKLELNQIINAEE